MKFTEAQLEKALQVFVRNFRHTTHPYKFNPIRGWRGVVLVVSPCFTRRYSSSSPSDFYKPQKEEQTTTTKWLNINNPECNSGKETNGGTTTTKWLNKK
jgi:hypothetical protein